MAVRERINRVKIEHWRISKIPIDKTEIIYQGDLLVFDQFTKLATKSAGLSGSNFIGMSDTTNPVETIGSTRFLSDTQYAQVNVIQSGLVEVIAASAKTVRAFDPVYLSATSAQHVAFTGTGIIGYVDPGFAGVSGKAVSIGDLVKIWLAVPAAYLLH